MGHLEDYFGPFGVSWDHLRGILGVMWAILGHLGDISGVKGGSWGALWAALGHAGKNNEKSTSRTRLFGSILGRFLESFLVPFFDDILDMRFDVFLVAGVRCFLTPGDPPKSKSMFLLKENHGFSKSRLSLLS